jgi:hypothetical protein
LEDTVPEDTEDVSADQVRDTVFGRTLEYHHRV